MKILTRENLEKYSRMEREIRRIQRKLEYYQDHPLVSEHGMVKGSMSQYPYAEKHFEISAPNVKSDRERQKKIRQLMVDLMARQKEYEDFELEIDIAIEDIPDLDLRQIIQYKYIEGLTDQEIADEMGYERSTISKKIATFTQITI